MGHLDSLLGHDHFLIGNTDPHKVIPILTGAPSEEECAGQKSRASGEEESGEARLAIRWAKKHGGSRVSLSVLPPRSGKVLWWRLGARLSCLS